MSRRILKAEQIACIGQLCIYDDVKYNLKCLFSNIRVVPLRMDPHFAQRDPFSKQIYYKVQTTTLPHMHDSMHKASMIKKLKNNLKVLTRI
jgi:hypothetical protein